MHANPAIELFSDPPRVLINARSVLSLPTIAEFHALLGPPSRIDSGEIPAPVKCRNNQIHVYDHLGLRLLEDHFTRRICEIACSWDVDDPLYRFTPRTPCAGTVTFDGVALPHAGAERDVARDCTWRFDRVLGGLWAFTLGEFHVALVARGARLRSGRRSKSKRIIEFSVSWSHDNQINPQDTA
jgi:hypothetical protein